MPLCALLVVSVLCTQGGAGSFTARVAARGRQPRPARTAIQAVRGADQRRDAPHMTLEQRRILYGGD